MPEIDVTFCFYDDTAYASDADRDSSILRAWHQRLWSKELPDGRPINWVQEPGSKCLTHDSSLGSFRVSSDTIASTHNRYARFGIPSLWAALAPGDQTRYDRAFYTIGGFIVFPAHKESLNQVRGRDSTIADRFDLTLECIRRHYLSLGGNPLGFVLEQNSDFFGAFGAGEGGFVAYVEFFHLQDLIDGNSVRWLDGFDGARWTFGSVPLPTTLADYRRYLDNVMSFVAARNARIATWVDAIGANAIE